MNCSKRAFCPASHTVINSTNMNIRVGPKFFVLPPQRQASSLNAFLRCRYRLPLYGVAAENFFFRSRKLRLVTVFQLSATAYLNSGIVTQPCLFPIWLNESHRNVVRSFRRYDKSRAAVIVPRRLRGYHTVHIMIPVRYASRTYSFASLFLNKLRSHSR